jgi:hypothetical protein
MELKKVVGGTGYTINGFYRWLALEYLAGRKK